MKDNSRKALEKVKGNTLTAMAVSTMETGSTIKGRDSAV